MFNPAKAAPRGSASRLPARAAEPFDLIDRLDQLTARFAHGAIAAAIVLFAFHAARHAARVWGLA